MIFFESPHRILKTLLEIREYIGERYVVVARELTKIYEETIRGDISSVISKLEDRQIKGEIVLLVEGTEANKQREKVQ